ncbi:hypothetical protein D9M68_47060 [compost metagenome]
MQWIDEAGLAGWAKRLDARAYLPDMIADLIRASITDASRFRFPGGDAGQIRGWDGNLETTESAEFVPAGKSKWEFGSGAGAAKANADYKKRTNKTDAAEMAENTLILVNLEKWDTPREQLTAWESARRKEKKWKDVIYLDAVELVHWLDRHPAVAALYARDVLFTAPQVGALSTDEFWDMYSARFMPRLHEKVVIGDRQEIADELLLNLAGPAQTVMLGAETAIEVVAFAVAAIRMAKPGVRRSLEVRTLIVESEAAARFLSRHTNLAFITMLAGDVMSGVLANKGPTLSAATGVQARKHTALKRSTANGMVDGFMEMGLEREEGYELAHRCGCSLTILQRLISNQPYQAPEWVLQARDLKAAFLAGGWSVRQELDKVVLKELSGFEDYATLEQKLLPTTMLADPPLDRVSEYWQVRAPVDAFSFYGHLLGELDLQRLRAAAIKVFSHVVEEPSREQKFSRNYVSPADYSKWLREGLALTLLIIATMDKIGGLHISNGTAQRYVDEIIDALPDWGRSHRSLVGLSEQTALLAEAAPNPFLTALESMLGGERSEVVRLFADQEDVMFGPSSPHIQVLWALEILAWDPKLLNRAALVLAKLAELDPTPDSRRMNRPINSLRDILLSWSPNTHATLKQRIACMDLVIAQVPAVGWHLLVKLLPRSQDTSSPTQKPKLRDVSPVLQEELTFGLVWDAEHAVVSRAIQMADGVEEKIILLVNHFSSFRPKDREAVLEFVDSHLSKHKSNEANPVWSALRAVVTKHEFFADSDWAIQEEERRSIKALLERHHPADPVSQDKQLFDDWMPHVGRYTPNDFNDPSILRKEALARILLRDGPQGVLELANHAALPNLVAQALDIDEITQQQLLILLEAAIDSTAPGDLALYASAIGARRYELTWADIFRVRICPLVKSAYEKATLLLGWPLATWTWDFVKSLGQDTDDEYWRRINALPQEGPSEVLLRAVEEFRRVHRSIDVLCSVHRRLGELPTELIFELLGEGLEQLAHANIQGGGSMLSYYLDTTFKELESRRDVKREDIARLEYAYLPLLSSDERPLVIYERLAQDPGLFVEVLSHVYRGKNSPPKAEVTDHEKSRARVSFRLLSSFKKVPGAKDGAVNLVELENWVTGVLKEATQRDLTEVAEQYIGQVLAHTVQGSTEEFWPPSAVCTVIERVASEQIERGVEAECFNKRGVYSKAMDEGGAQERALSEKYQHWAVEASHFPRTSAMLGRIADSWLVFAEQEDLRAEVNKLKR